jgi:hypothetical protein
LWTSAAKRTKSTRGGGEKRLAVHSLTVHAVLPNAARSAARHRRQAGEQSLERAQVLRRDGVLAPDGFGEGDGAPILRLAESTTADIKISHGHIVRFWPGRAGSAFVHIGLRCPRAGEGEANESCCYGWLAFSYIGAPEGQDPGSRVELVVWVVASCLVSKGDVTTILVTPPVGIVVTALSLALAVYSIACSSGLPTDICQPIRRGLRVKISK